MLIDNPVDPLVFCSLVKLVFKNLTSQEVEVSNLERLLELLEVVWCVKERLVAFLHH